MEIPVGVQVPGPAAGRVERIGNPVTVVVRGGRTRLRRAGMHVRLGVVAVPVDRGGPGGVSGAEAAGLAIPEPVEIFVQAERGAARGVVAVCHAVAVVVVRRRTGLRRAGVDGGVHVVTVPVHSHEPRGSRACQLIRRCITPCVGICVGVPDHLVRHIGVVVVDEAVAIFVDPVARLGRVGVRDGICVVAVARVRDPA